MEANILAAYDRPVPRYTSYPTAAQFDSSVGPHQHADWLRALRSGESALYLHVPFCRQLCWYCACHTMAMRREGTLDAYRASGFTLPICTFPLMPLRRVLATSGSSRRSVRAGRSACAG